jgi:hypothetical protein
MNNNDYNGTDRVQLLKTLNISVNVEMVGDSISLSRYGITIPYNYLNFMLYNTDFLLSDILRRFREKQMDIPNVNEDWKKMKHEMNIQQMRLIEESHKPNITYVDTTVSKKQNIRDKLIKKGLLDNPV